MNITYAFLYLLLTITHIQVYSAAEAPVLMQEIKAHAQSEKITDILHERLHLPALQNIVIDYLDKFERISQSLDTCFPEFTGPFIPASHEEAIIKPLLVGNQYLLGYFKRTHNNFEESYLEIPNKPQSYAISSDGNYICAVIHKQNNTSMLRVFNKSKEPTDDLLIPENTLKKDIKTIFFRCNNNLFLIAYNTTANAKALIWQLKDTKFELMHHLLLRQGKSFVVLGCTSHGVIFTLHKQDDLETNQILSVWRMNDHNEYTHITSQPINIHNGIITFSSDQNCIAYRKKIDDNTIAIDVLRLENNQLKMITINPHEEYHRPIDCSLILSSDGSLLYLLHNYTIEIWKIKGKVAEYRQSIFISDSTTAKTLIPINNTKFVLTTSQAQQPTMRILWQNFGEIIKNTTSQMYKNLDEA
jgi:hypothetical protein